MLATSEGWGGEVAQCKREKAEAEAGKRAKPKAEARGARSAPEGWREAPRSAHMATHTPAVQ